VIPEIFVLGYCDPAHAELHLVDDMQRQPGGGCQAPGERRLAAAGVAEYRNPPHLT
jgi:hypothetical protein